MTTGPPCSSGKMEPPGASPNPPHFVPVIREAPRRHSSRSRTTGTLRPRGSGRSCKAARVLVRTPSDLPPLVTLNVDAMGRELRLVTTSRLTDSRREMGILEATVAGRRQVAVCTSVATELVAEADIAATTRHGSSSHVPWPLPSRPSHRSSASGNRRSRRGRRERSDLVQTPMITSNATSGPSGSNRPRSGSPRHARSRT